jgi:hypothetical protein
MHGRTEPPIDQHIDRHTFAITFFPDRTAQSVIEAPNPTLPELADAIRRSNAVDKAELPWLKLAAFGDKRSRHNSLRHDANVLEISGIEGDYDAEQMTMDEAIERARQARIRCLFYTSPSFAPERPRWRILAPLSKNHPPSDRDGLVAVINGLFGGVLGGESFTLSQSYYFGSVNGNPGHRVEVLDGDFLDLRPDLTGAAIGGRASNGAAAAGSSRGTWTREQVTDSILRGEYLHESLVSLSAKLVVAGMEEDEIENHLRDLMNRSKAPRDSRWHERYDDIPRSVESAVYKYRKFAPADHSKGVEALRELAAPGVIQPSPLPQLARAVGH